MANFNHLKKFDVSTTKPIAYTLYQLEDEPTLMLKPATEVNKPFFNQLLRRARKNNKIVQAGAISAQLIAANREEDRELYANHVVADWKNVNDSNGKSVDFSALNCLDFLKALPDHIFDEIRVFASSPLNFVEDLDAEGAAKN